MNLEIYFFLSFSILACLLMLKFIFDMKKIRLPVKCSFRFQNQSFVSDLLSEFEFEFDAFLFFTHFISIGFDNSSNRQCWSN